MLSYTRTGAAWTNPNMVTSAECMVISQYRDDRTTSGLALCEDHQVCPRASDVRDAGRLQPDYMHREALEVLPELLANASRALGAEPA